ncbi:Hypothetical predicted protein [Drosophila guanche]|uniref:Ionotropic glutamate receptor C-terminal domain-containing protein n=1 Tax=Drosophila guanche TaxID=7266 RepID=A0A3B0IZ36_DROGU|nr:Hypothetical predicted protein [Drosophila guanche]
MCLRTFFTLVFTISLAEATALGNIVKSIKRELSFGTILLLRNEKDADYCWTREDFPQDIPILNLNSNQSLYLKQIFNSEILAMVCQNRSEGDTMKTLYRNLQDIRYTPTIVMTRSDTNLSALFEDCRSHKVVKRRVIHILRYFEPQVRNMQGSPINVLPDNIMPRTVVYRDGQGRRQMTGYLAHLMRNFASTLNATMNICWEYVPEEEVTNKTTMVKLSNDGFVDFPLVITGPHDFLYKDIIVMESSSWFLILPTEANTPRARLFCRTEAYKLVPLLILLALVLSYAQRLEEGLGPSVSLGSVWEYVLHGVLAQPLSLPHGPSSRVIYIYGLLFFASMLTCSIFNVSLETWLVHPPVDRMILSFQDMLLEQRKILFYHPEYFAIQRIFGEERFENIRDIFEITNSSKHFQMMRSSLNQSYAYPITTTMWPLLQLGQSRLTRPIFRRSKEMIFNPLVLLSITLPKDSIYREAFTHFHLRTLNSGLYKLWFRRTFNELVELGMMSYQVDNSPQPYKDLVWGDFIFVWMLYVGGIFASLLVFLVEIFYFKWQRNTINN